MLGWGHTVELGYFYVFLDKLATTKTLDVDKTQICECETNIVLPLDDIPCKSWNQQVRILANKQNHHFGPNNMSQKIDFSYTLHNFDALLSVLASVLHI